MMCITINSVSPVFRLDCLYITSLFVSVVLSVWSKCSDSNVFQLYSYRQEHVVRSWARRSFILATSGRNLSADTRTHTPTHTPNKNTRHEMMLIATLSRILSECSHFQTSFNFLPELTGERVKWPYSRMWFS